MKQRTIINVVLFLSLIFSSSSLMAQGRELSNNERLQRAKELYYNDLFVSAEHEFKSLLANIEQGGELHLHSSARCSRTEVETYIVLCAIKLSKPNVDNVVMEYSEKYPFVPELSRVLFAWSEYYFEREDYARSLEIMNTILIASLPNEEKIEYQFNRAYCNLKEGKIVDAARGFDTVLSFERNKFTKTATYYRAYLYYLSEDFTRAVSLFESMLNDPQYGLVSAYYLLESKFMLKQYDYVISRGEELYNRMQGEFKPKVARIISESYFAVDKPKEAKHFFDLYSGSATNISRKDNYYLGVVSYTLESYYTAIDAFSKVPTEADTLAQSALYHLGNCYIKIKNKHLALSAFKSASEMNFDPVIREDAMFNWAKLAFDLNSDISGFTNYLGQYPSSSRSDDIYNYMATSFLLKKDYDAAIDALEKIRKRTPEMTLNLQKAAFFRAMQYVGSGAYRPASQLLDLSIRNGQYNPTLEALAQFWQAEVAFRSGMNNQSILLYNNLLTNRNFQNSAEFPLIYYNLGYSHFKSGDFKNAIKWFKTYLDLPSHQREFTTEARTRLADSYFMLRDYENAAMLYEQIAAANYNATDFYAAYQSAVSYGLLSDARKKINILEKITRNGEASDMYDQAMFELGRTYTQNDRYDDAKHVFQRLIAEGREAPYYLKSMLEMGMISSNLAQYDQALQYYKAVVEISPLSEEGESALAGIENIYQMDNKTEEFLAYLDSAGLSSVKSADEKEIMLFNSAEQVFLSGNYSGAVVSLNSYIKQYPLGAKQAQAYFYMGESLNKLGRLEESADAYFKVMTMGEGAFVELSTLNYAKLSYQLQKWNEAIDAYESLYQIAKLENNKFEARVGMMRSYYRNNDYDKAVIEAQNLLQSNTSRSELRREANYIAGKSYLAKGERERAIPILTTLSQENMTPEGAEASYLLIVDAFDAGDFVSVENQVFNFSDSGTPELYWLAKSFIVLGDSYAEREEWEQAKATFNSIKEGYSPQSDSDDVLGQVEMRLKKLQQQ